MGKLGVREIINRPESGRESSTQSVCSGENVGEVESGGGEGWTAVICFLTSSFELAVSNRPLQYYTQVHQRQRRSNFYQLHQVL